MEPKKIPTIHNGGKVVPTFTAAELNQIYRDHDILILGEDGAEDITAFPFGPEQNIVDNRG